MSVLTYRLLQICQSRLVVAKSLLWNLFHTTHRVKARQVVKSRGQWCGNIELAAYLTNSAGRVLLVFHLRIAHHRWGSNSNPSINGHLHYPDDMDRTLNEDGTDKILQYRVDYNNRPSHVISFIPPIVSTSGCLHGEFVWFLFLQTHREIDRFLAPSGVQIVETNFHVRLSEFFSQLKSKFDNILTKVVLLRVNLNIDGSPITSRSHTHPSHTQNSRLLTSSLSLDVPVPHSTQCMWDV